LDNEQRLHRKSARAVERINEKNPARHRINLFQWKSKKATEDFKFHPLPNQFRNTKYIVAKDGRKRVKVGWRLASGFLVVLFSALLLSAWYSPDYQVGEILVNGNQRITQEEVLHSFSIVGMPLLMIDPWQITTALLDSFPEFNEVKVEVTLPNQILVSISERQPILTWKETRI
jgi:cell division septal protein FtsQ